MKCLWGITGHQKDFIALYGHLWRKFEFEIVRG
jgi:hypothetical protein